ncbi:MAG: heat-inducible transcriptional repressor HrcA [Candidatus Eremiobacteraeota bacterium]|nr:heat-inducible transcriptional repressor HrcA [Candidatus Eremiobacteraeota bacterium]
MDEFFSKRKHAILVTLIQEFIATAEPVGSTYLVRKYDFNISPATMRNELAKLEDMGFLFQPYTSSGRIPTDKAYRYYVNFLMQEKLKPPMDVESTLEEFKRLEIHLQNLMEYTSKMLADLTHYTSLVLAPRFKKTLFRYLRITPIEGNRLLLILMTNTGSVLNKVIPISREISEEQLNKLTGVLNERLQGMFLEDIDIEFLQGIAGDLQEEILQHLGLLTKETVLGQESKFVYEGARHLLDLPEFQNLERLRMLFEILEDEKVLAEILKNTLTSEGMKIYIGREHHHKEIEECSLITATYGIGEVPLGTIAIMGPTRMPYGRIIPVVSACAQIFSDKLKKMAE